MKGLAVKNKTGKAFDLILFIEIKIILGLQIESN